MTLMNANRSVDVLGHDCIKILKADLSVLVAVGLLQHQSQGLELEVLFDVVVHVLEVIQGQIVLVLSVVFLENAGDHLLVLVAVGLRVHGLHELQE